ncbi:hypothetical protein V6Z11_A06G069100 [Gossypium hirsutum]
MLKGIKASRRGPQITRLLFVDDCVLFGEANEKGAKTFGKILKEYEACSGQSINYGKSTVFFSSNTTEMICLAISNKLRVKRTNNTEKYLGLPNMVGKRKRLAFQHLKDRIKAKINCRSSQLLLQGEKKFSLNLCYKQFQHIQWDVFYYRSQYALIWNKL